MQTAGYLVMSNICLNFVLELHVGATFGTCHCSAKLSTPVTHAFVNTIIRNTITMGRGGGGVSRP